MTRFEEGELDGACGICGRALEWLVRQDGSDGRWVHASEDQIIGVDHEPLHVSEKDIIPTYRCDFCSADNPAYEIPTHSFDNTGGVPGVGSVGNWMCCSECKPFIDDGAWKALVERVIRHNQTMAREIASGNFRESDVRRFLTHAYADVKRNMITKPVPIGTVSS